MKFQRSELYLKTIITLSILFLIAAIIWVSGPYLSWQNYIPLADEKKRYYAILFIFLIWLLKFIMFDLDTPNPFQFKDLQIRGRVQDLYSRFIGALQFLKKTTIVKQSKLTKLNELPWFLLLGPKNAGKTSLLANSNINYILQRQFSHQNTQHLDPSDHCDWWITREASIIDVPGKYLTIQEPMKDKQKVVSIYSILWSFFLRLLKNKRGKNAIDGIIIAIPLAEIMKETDLKKYHIQLHNLFYRLHEFQKVFPQTVPCYLMITKCDLLSGFVEFFAESGNDELAQAWGVMLPDPKANEKIYNLFVNRFNALIKKLNQQLLWRLHQERNPMARPYIKDFPLQVERLKEFVLDFIKRFDHAKLNLSLKGVYLTSALQQHPEKEPTVIDDGLNTTHRAVQIFKDPIPATRAYFIKQFLLQGVGTASSQPVRTFTGYAWKQYFAYTFSLLLIGFTALMLGRDFKEGVKQTYSVQNYFSEYQLALQETQDPDDHLAKTVNLLDTLEASTKNKDIKIDFSYLLTFYSHKSQQKTNIVYRQALKNILMPQVKHYFEEYLKNPVNKNSEYVYAVLKSYLMLGDAKYFQPDFVFNTIHKILPTSLDQNKTKHLLVHLTEALNSTLDPLTLDGNSVQQTRKFLGSMSNLQLSYIILKNINSNDIPAEINLGTNRKRGNIFQNLHVSNHIPTMYTAKFLPNIINKEVNMAAEEATFGGWVLGVNANATEELSTILQEQLRTAYLTNYINIWETLLNHIKLAAPQNLKQMDALIIRIVSHDSPLLQLLQTVHDNTYFEPLISSSPKLQNVGLLIDKNQHNDTLYQIFSSLRSLHHYIQAIVSSDNVKKAAFEAVSHRMLSRGAPDAIQQVRIVAEKSPEPIKTWLNSIANNTWHFLMKEAGRYIDTSWQEQVGNIYQHSIANRYPFTTNAKQEVNLQKFVHFFGNPGSIVNFYNLYLQNFVDTSLPDWRWKTLENDKLPFSDETLRQIQQALHIHRTFFPNGDDKLYVQFALQPYQFGKEIKSVKLNINDKQIVDKFKGSKAPHLIVWLDSSLSKKTSVQLTLANQKILHQEYPGEWGWFKLVNQSFETAVSKKQLVLNLSMSNQPAKYLLMTQNQFNPFLTLNLHHFSLPEKLTKSKS